jgi:hypothetical protein
MAFGAGAGSFRFRPTERLSLAPYIGARWWCINTELDIVDNGGPLPPFSGGGILKWADPIFGLKVGCEITDKWRVRAVGDVSGGVSKVSWQALFGGSDQSTSCFAFYAVYRVMGVDYPKSGNKFEMKLNGVLFGFNFHY